MFLAKPFFTSLIGKAGSFLLGKAKNFLTRNLDTVKQGAIDLIKNGNLQQTLKNTASNILSSEKKHLTKAIQRGEGKLKKIITKQERNFQQKLKGRQDYQMPQKKYIPYQPQELMEQYQQGQPKQYQPPTLSSMLSAAPANNGRFQNYEYGGNEFDGISRLYNRNDGADE